jgi:long-chain-fatty-acid--CoA ligase ACSBG
VHWTTDKNTEIPVKIRQSGMGSEKPRTMCEMFYNTAMKYKDRNALNVQREGKHLKWTWSEYLQDCITFAKALYECNV